MTALQSSHEPEFRLPRIVARFASTLGALAAASLRILTRSDHVPHWRSLDEPLLRDIGATPLDAEIARLEARMGTIETDDLEAIARRGVSAGQFLRQLNSRCYRDGV